jgi:histidinol-phosphatase (PHP family)
MFYADQHMHSSVSFDSDSPRAAMAEAAVRAGLSALCFTDHYDVVDEFGVLHPDYDWAPARAEQARAQALWGDRIALGYGVELGNAPADFAAAERVLQEPGLDLVIGSIHNGSEAVGKPDYYNVNYDSVELCHRHLSDYFQSMLALARWGGFDVLGHIPYPLRYMRDRDGQDVDLIPYMELIREILRCTVAAGRGIELNTCQFHPGSAADYAQVLTLYRELGGEIVTVGADAHEPSKVAFALREGYALLGQCGFRYAARYVGRNPEFYPLEEVSPHA